MSSVSAALAALDAVGHELLLLVSKAEGHVLLPLAVSSTSNLSSFGGRSWLTISACFRASRSRRAVSTGPKTGARFKALFFWIRLDRRDFPIVLVNSYV